MKKSRISSVLSIVLFSFITLTSEAALIGVLPTTPGGTDYQAYYDDVADLTWLADANPTAGSVYDTIIPGTGRMNWSDANTWVTGLSVNGITGWRLPTTLQPDASCSIQGTDASYGNNCSGSEMGNMFYNVLGGEAGRDIYMTHNSNFDLFSNIQVFYWSSTMVASSINSAWTFSFFEGNQFGHDKSLGSYAWAVQSGNVGAVPIPAAAWLFTSGLLGLIGTARARK
jgi:hypothetical protein